MDIYLDNCATTQVCSQAVEACVKAMIQDYGNPSSLHRMGMDAEQILTKTRKIIATILKGDPDNVYFTSGATESNNLAILGAAALRARAGKTIITTTIEHPSVENSCAHLEKEGFRIKRIAPKDGNFDPQDFIEAIDDDTILLSAMLVNNEIGTIFPYEEVVSAARRKSPKLLLHMDGVQGFTKLPLNLKKLDLDLFSFSGHKLYAPKGIGGLYVKKGIRLPSVTYGGGQEKGMRSGTQSVPLIAALGEALSLCATHEKEFSAHYKTCNQYLRNLLQDLPEVAINSPANGAPHLLNFSVCGIPSEIILHALEQQNIYVSSGSACSKGAISTILGNFGFSQERVRSAIRVSFSKDTTIEQLDIFYEALRANVEKLKKVIK